MREGGDGPIGEFTHTQATCKGNLHPQKYTLKINSWFKISCNDFWIPDLFALPVTIPNLGGTQDRGKKGGGHSTDEVHHK